MRDPYSVLGLFSDATDEEVKTAYRNLARKYHPDNYKDDNPLKDLAKEKMQEINAAYDEIQRMRANASSSSHTQSEYSQGSANGIYAEIRGRIIARRFKEAEALLATVPVGERVADWHFLNSVCLKQRGMIHDAMRELELACSMDPSNMEYQRAKEMFNTEGSRYGSTYYGEGRATGRTSSDDACDCCMNLMCLDCLCECMGGDLIRCI